MLPFAAPYWNAFSLLSERRAWHEGYPRFIPLTEIMAYCDYDDEDEPEERAFLARMVMALDRVYVEFKSKQAQKKQQKQSGKKPPVRPAR